MRTPAGKSLRAIYRAAGNMNTQSVKFVGVLGRAFAVLARKRLEVYRSEGCYWLDGVSCSKLSKLSSEFALSRLENRE